MFDAYCGIGTVGIAAAKGTDAVLEGFDVNGDAVRAGCDRRFLEALAIVLEELSALEAGVGTAEDCAKKIQPRASIWLAEHN